VVSRQDSQGTASHRPNIGLNRASPSRGSASGWPSETANLLCRCRHAIAFSLLTTIQFDLGDRPAALDKSGFATGIFILISDHRLRKTITDLKSLERKCFASRSRFAFYDYLAAVFELYVRLSRTKRAKKAATRVAKLFGLRKQNHTHCIRVIIDATSTADIKSRSRWTRALKYAWRERRTWKDLGSFLRENGGPAACGAAIIRGLGNLRVHGDQISLVLEAGAQFRQLTRDSCV
jgi:hypothetical protein